MHPKLVSGKGPGVAMTGLESQGLLPGGPMGQFSLKHRATGRKDQHQPGLC